jgi:Arc/MetJ-type ribon-helix-helix transcriptional regulator
MVKIMISLSRELLKKVDRAANGRGRRRDELIREALQAMLAEDQRGRRSWEEALAPLKKLERQWIGQWNSTDVVRYDRQDRRL